MVFSFFGKKDPPPKPPAKATPRPAGRPVAERPAGTAAPTRPAEPARPRDTPAATAPPRVAEPAPATSGAAPAGGLDVPPPKEDLPSLDFTASASFNATPSEIASSIELHESSDQVHPLVEEAAILYANGNDLQCLKVLEAGSLRSDLGASSEQVWMMLFELYHVLDRREAFDAKALEYVVRFERSPPAWRGAAGAEAAAGGGSAPMSSLGPMLDASAAKQFDSIARLIAKNPGIRLDVGKVKEVDAEGCAQLLACLRAAKKDRHEVIVQNAAHLARLVESRVAAGQRENESAWLLLLELFQQQGLADKYEEWALEYAVTFEVSPPAWEPPRAKPKAAVMAAPAPPPAGPAPAADAAAFALVGEMSGACAPVMQQMKAHASSRDALVVDLSQLRRIDFVCAGNLLNTLFEAGAGGKPIRLTQVSALVAALLKVVGVAEAASVERRRY